MKVSVVTVSFNAASTLADTLESVSRQQGCKVEHWLVDGGSRDDTAVVARRHGAHLAGFVSEPDRGLYDAMNKGAALSRGDVLGFLNADDWYASANALAWVADAFDQGADVVYGDLVFITPSPPFQVRRVWRDASHVTEDFFRFGWQPAHPTTFVRRELFEAAGGFDLRRPISADYAFLARVMSRPNIRLLHLPRTLVNMRLGGASTAGWRSVWNANRECLQALREDGHRAWATVGMKLLRKVPQLVARPGIDGGPLWRPWAAA
jgi:hypothetical protein